MKIDFKKELPTYSSPSGRFELVTVPSMHYLMVDGRGDPNTSTEYAEAVATIYPVAYRLKFLSKKELDRDYVVMPLEALWWSDDMESFTSARDKSRWSWTVMIMVPEWLGQEHVDAARDAANAKATLARPADLRLETLDEGLAVQTLHRGSYDDEGPVLEKMHDGFIPQHALRMAGHHHEIYLSDSRRTAPERLRTILRQPVEHL